jgi:hypothetical protein
MGSTSERKKTKIGFDYIHSIVDDHSRLAYSEIHEDETGETCAAFFERAIDFYASHGITIERVITDNHWSYKHTTRLSELIAGIGATHKFIRPHCPWQERESRTFQPHPANRVGPTGKFSSPTTTDQQLCQTSSTATTTNGDTTPSAVNHRSADCRQPDGRVQLDANVADQFQAAGDGERLVGWVDGSQPGIERRSDITSERQQPGEVEEQ